MSTITDLEMKSTIAAFREGPRSQAQDVPAAENFQMQAYPSCGKDIRHSAALADSRRSSRLPDSNGPKIEEKMCLPPVAVELWEHISDGNVTGLESCLRKGADVNELRRCVGGLHEPTAPPRIMPLVAALRKRHGRVEIIEVLLKYGADPNSCDGDGLEAYHYALKTEDPETIKVMVTALSGAQILAESLPEVHVGSSLDGPESTLKRIAWNAVLDFISGNNDQAHKLTSL